MARPEEKVPTKAEKQIDEGLKFMKENRHRTTIAIYSDEFDCVLEKASNIYEIVFNAYALGFVKGKVYAEKHMKKKK